MTSGNDHQEPSLEEIRKTGDGRIVLDYPMDVLFDRRCRLERYESGVIKSLRENGSPAPQCMPKLLPDEKLGGLSFPDGKGDPGSGNVLLVGKPGTGKSTLALQWAVVCTQEPNRYSSLFISLEETAGQVMKKADDLGWKGPIRELRFCQIGEYSSEATPEQQARSLGFAVSRPRTCALDGEACEPSKHEPPKQGEGEGRLFLATLTPKASDCSDSQRTFHERYRQIEDLLMAFARVRPRQDVASPTNEPIPSHSPGSGESISRSAENNVDLRMVCIDGLASFGDGPLSREQIRQLFSLFQRCGVVGICTTEAAATAEVLELEYLADIVVHLRSEEDSTYLVRHLEITKSRYQQQVNGRHPFRIRRPDEKQKNDEKAKFQTVIVTPSIHYISYATRLDDEKGDQKTAATEPSEPLNIGSPKIRDILPQGLNRPAVVTIRGKSGTFKSSIAHNFLMRGIVPHRDDSRDARVAPEGESVLLLTLGEKTRFSGDTSDWLLDDSTTVSRGWKEKKEHRIHDGKLWRRVWRYRRNGALLIEIAFKQGALLAEEFIEYVRDAFLIPKATRNERLIGRVVLDDVSMIGTSYPLLRHSGTAGDLCLSTFVHLMGTKRANLIMVGSPGNFVEADEMVNRACTLSDTVLSCDFCDIFGQRRVLVTGEGLISGRSPEGGSQVREGGVVPGVMVVTEKSGKSHFKVDRKILDGLVGYEKGNIHRPGVVLHVFSEGDILKSYNRELETMLERACASPAPADFGPSGGHERGLTPRTVTVQPFGSDRSEAIHDSLTILGQRPVDKTVLVAVDEFAWADVKAAGAENAEGTKIEECFAQIEPEERQRNHVPEALKDRVRPYYANVLVLAYNTAVLPVEEGESAARWSNILSMVKKHVWVPPSPPTGRSAQEIDDPWSAFLDEWFAKPLLKRPRAGAQAPRIYWPFEAGAWSLETLACILLDAIASSMPGPTESKDDKSREQMLFDFIKKLKEEAAKKDSRVRKELTSLAYLFYYSWRHWALDINRAQAMKIEKRLANKLVPNAAVYVCWYSQLRELIDEYPQLGSMLRVRPLPGGGFKGDWFIGVLKGSVSHSLGTSVLNTLCSEDEDRKRFVRGVGLPTYTSGVNEALKAWPRAMEEKGEESSLVKMIEIHRNARSRSMIPNYKKLRGSLGAFGRQIAFSAADEALSTDKAVDDCIDRLPKIVRSPDL